MSEVVAEVVSDGAAPQAGTGTEARAFAVLARLFRGPASKPELLEAAASVPCAGRPVSERTIRRYLSAAHAASFQIQMSKRGGGRYELSGVPGEATAIDD